MSVAYLRSRRKPVLAGSESPPSAQSRDAWVVVKAGGGLGAVVLTLALFTNSVARLPDMACFFMSRCGEPVMTSKPGRGGWTVVVDRVAADEDMVMPASGAALAAVRGTRYIETAQDAPPDATRDIASSSRVSRALAGANSATETRFMRSVRLNCERNCN